MRKRNGFLAYLAVLIALVFVLAACGGSDDESEPASDAAQQTETTDRSGPVSAEVTGGEVGDAVTADASGVEEQGRGGEISGKAKKKGKKGEVSVGAGAACANAELAPTDSNLAEIEAAILCLVNGERSDAGVGSVASNGQLKDASVKHSQDMVSNKFFAHEGSGGSTLVTRVEPTGYIPDSDDWKLGENLAFGTGALATPKAIVQGWLDSPKHKENMLDPEFKDIGIGIITGVPVEGRSGGATYTTDYGLRGAGAAGPGGDGSGDGSGTDSEATTSGDGSAGVAGITKAAKRKCAKRKRVAKKVRGKVRCVKKKRRR